MGDAADYITDTHGFGRDPNNITCKYCGETRSDVGSRSRDRPLAIVHH
jgi:hypothetical protein